MSTEKRIGGERRLGTEKERERERKGESISICFLSSNWEGVTSVKRQNYNKFNLKV
jgi:hypothetical protein